LTSTAAFTERRTSLGRASFIRQVTEATTDRIGTRTNGKSCRLQQSRKRVTVRHRNAKDSEPNTKQALAAPALLAALAVAALSTAPRKPRILLNGIILTGTDIIGIPQTNSIELNASVTGLIHRKGETPWIRIAIPTTYPPAQKIIPEPGWQSLPMSGCAAWAGGFLKDRRSVEEQETGGSL
jgi:hypothetical protein